MSHTVALTLRLPQDHSSSPWNKLLSLSSEESEEQEIIRLPLHFSCSDCNDVPIDYHSEQIQTKINTSFISTLCRYFPRQIRRDQPLHRP